MQDNEDQDTQNQEIKVQRREAQRAGDQDEPVTRGDAAKRNASRGVWLSTLALAALCGLTELSGSDTAGASAAVRRAQNFVVKLSPLHLSPLHKAAPAEVKSVLTVPVQSVPVRAALPKTGPALRAAVVIKLPVSTSMIRYAPRDGWEGRMVGGQFQGSADGVAYTTFYTITKAPTADQWALAIVPQDLSGYRFLRYLAPAHSHGNIAELEFDSHGTKLAGISFGTAGSGQNQGNTFANAFDGQLDSYFDAPDEGQDFVGIDRRAPVQIPPVPVQLPIEVMGADGTTQSVQVSVPASAAAAVTGLWMQAHNLSYADKASVQVNGGPWLPLNNNSVQVSDPGKSYGGIGGGFSTIKLLLPLPNNSVTAGTNTISFRFNGTDGVSSGFRVLAFNFMNAAGQPVLPASTFIQDDPNTWQPPMTDTASVAAGQTLWQQGQLVESSLVHSPIHAACADCHTDDGRDLKYFNYSNYSIVQRSQFHGLSAVQGQQIASYIRTLPVPNPGQPWNPPYQPGPGLDSQPVQNWAAGAGVDAVLTKTSDMLPYIFPSTGGTPNAGDIAANKNLNMRELPIPLQLPDWNHWLPPVWPGDIPGAGFAKSLALGRYNGSTPGYAGPNALSAAAQAQARLTPTNLHNLTYNYLPGWLAQVQDFATSHAVNPSESTSGPGIGAGSVPLTPQTATEVYSVGLWGRVKEWHIMQKFGLENLGQVNYGPTTLNSLPIENRVWYTGATFETSPGFLGLYGNDLGANAAAQFAALYPSAPPINQNPLSLSPAVPGTKELFAEERVNWYWLQLILDDGDYNRSGNSPIDWGYLPGTLIGLGVTNGTDTGPLYYATRVKMMQQFNNGVAPDQANPYVQGWDISETNLGIMPVTDYPFWGDEGDALKTSLVSTYLAAWLPAAKQYAPQQYWTQGRISQFETTAQASQGYIGSPDAAQTMYSQIPYLKKLRVDPVLTSNYVGWLKTVLPKVDWDNDK